MRKLSSERLSHVPIITQPGRGKSWYLTQISFHITLVSCCLWVCEPAFYDLRICAMPKCAVLMQLSYDSKRGWVSYSLCIRLMTIANCMPQNTQNHSGPYNFPHKETHQVLGYLLSFSWVAENTSENRSVPSSPRRGLQPKNAIPFFLPKHRHHSLE